MNYGVIVAGGTGSRITGIDIPKQFYEINGKAIILYSIKTMLDTKMFDKIYIAVDKRYESYMESILTKEEREYICLVNSGKERIDSIHNVLEEMQKEKINEDDIVVIHDAARPFVSKEILINNVNEARKNNAVVTAIPTTDTILIVEDGKIKKIPNRNTIYNEQTPTSANLKLLIHLEKKLTSEDKKVITGTAQIFTYNNYNVKIIEGDDSNFKITTDEDLERAKQKITKNKKNSKFVN